MCDFQEVTEEKLEFGNGETSKKIKLKVNMNSKVILSISNHLLFAHPEERLCSTVEDVQHCEGIP